MMQQNILVTTSVRAGRWEEEKAKLLAGQFGFYVPRQKQPLPAMLEKWRADTALVVEQNRLLLHLPGGHTYFFHPSMAKLRLKALAQGKVDMMLQAFQINKGERVLDCTLGLGADSIVAAFGVGEEGQVVGIEKNPLLAFLVREGMAGGDLDPLLSAVFSRITVLAGDSCEFLKKQPARSFHVVYFDPMFRQPVEKTSAFEPLRLLADHQPVSREAITEARRVAIRRVVLKERKNSPEFARLGFAQVLGGKNSPVAYGIIECDRE